MKKTAIVSCYFQPNYGSMLQALATQMALDKLGFENETIDISGFSKEIRTAKLKFFVKESLTSSFLITKLGRVKSSVSKRFLKNDYTKKAKERDKVLREFSEQNFRLSPCFTSKKKLSAQCDSRYSAVLVGSDQLWLPGNIAGDYYTLSFVPETVNTVAYATSFGQASIPKSIEKATVKFVKRIRHISIREESGQRLIQKLTDREVPIVCDPTLLFTADEWTAIQSDKGRINEPYIFCYFLGNNLSHRKFAERLKMETGCKIVTLPHLDEYVKYDDIYSDIALYDVDPAGFINLVRNASYICTDSFHCSVFSILYEKTFFAFRRFKSNNVHSTNSRLDTLFNITGISGRIMSGEENVSECLKLGIDYNSVCEKLKQIRTESYEYLLKALKDEADTDLA